MDQRSVFGQAGCLDGANIAIDEAPATVGCGDIGVKVDDDDPQRSGDDLVLLLCCCCCGPRIIILPEVEAVPPVSGAAISPGGLDKHISILAASLSSNCCKDYKKRGVNK